MTEKVFDSGRDQWTVTISGEIDMYNVGLLKKELSEIDRGDVRLECREMTYIDSTGIGTLASELSRLKNAGYRIVIAGAQTAYLQDIQVDRNGLHFFAGGRR